MRKEAAYLQAIQLRRAGKSYREILVAVPVAKSTLSLWLRSVGLAQAQKQRLTKKRLDAVRRAAILKKDQRLQSVRSHIEAGVREVGALSTRERWLIGAALYWAEGSKQHPHSPSVGVIFANSDVEMHRFFFRWLRVIGIADDLIRFELFVHDSRRAEVREFIGWWTRELGIATGRLETVYYKKGNIKTSRKNVADLYHGLLRIRVSGSASLNRKIQGWICGIANVGSK